MQGACVPPHTAEAGEAALEFLRAAKAEIRVCWEDARRSAAGLRPLELERRGLAGALAGFARRLSRTADVTVSFVTRGTPSPLPEAAELAVLRVGQESVTNALRHSGAKIVSMELSYDADAVRLEVVDNGSGFDPQSILPEGGWQSMRDRANEVGAELSILAGPGAGTRVIMTVPLTVGGRAEIYLG